MKQRRRRERLVAAAALASAYLGAMQVALPHEQLTEFQWALVNRGALLLVPVDGRLYPAKLAREGEIETQPVRVSVALYESNKKMTPALLSIVSPFALDPSRWVAQKRVGDEWIDARTFVFVDGKFYLLDASAFVAVDPAVLRFVPSKQQ